MSDQENDRYEVRFEGDENCDESARNTLLDAADGTLTLEEAREYCREYGVRALLFTDGGDRLVAEVDRTGGYTWR